eukprot:3575291-Pleurochrysis_carterae.AAC.2
MSPSFLQASSRPCEAPPVILPPIASMLTAAISRPLVAPQPVCQVRHVCVRAAREQLPQLGGVWRAPLQPRGEGRDREAPRRDGGGL